MPQDKITDVFASKQRTLSFEFFPPKTDKGRDRLFDTAEKLVDLGADWFSVTYGAGGTTAENTLRTAEELIQSFDIPVVHHFTCIKHTWDSIRRELGRMKRSGVRNLMALRGDPPQHERDYQFRPDQPRYAYQLVEMARSEHDDHFSIGVAGFPESHPLAPNLDVDSHFLKMKQDAGADYCITQFFFENMLYWEYLQRVREAGVTMRVIPGLLPVTDYEKLVDFAANCGATVPQTIHEIFDPIKDDAEATQARGTDYAVSQAQDLLDRGAPGLHFYCLNRAEPVTTIFKSLKF
ncbi:MAG: methylenetetrahydrofolate reductase [Phycisphaerae bacterium]